MAVVALLSRFSVGPHRFDVVHTTLNLYYCQPLSFCHLPVVHMTYQAVYLTGMTQRLYYPVVAVSC